MNELIVFKRKQIIITIFSLTESDETIKFFLMETHTHVGQK